MELWIRSQDKKCLIKANIIEYENYSGAILKGATDIDSNYHTLGKYKTKERALEVLDEIQNLLSLKCTISGDYETQDLQIKALNLQTQRLIYNMPKE